MKALFAGSKESDQQLAEVSTGDFASLRKELASLREEIKSEKQDREKDVKSLQTSINVLEQRSAAESAARFKLAEHVHQLIGEAKCNVEAVCAECAKQQDSIRNLWGQLSKVARIDQSPVLTVQDLIMEAKRLSEKVRAECQEHERMTEGLLSTLQGATKVLSFDSPPEDVHGKKDIVVRMDQLSKSARQRLEAVLPEYQMQLIATQDLLNSIAALRTVFEKQNLEKIAKAQGLDDALRNFTATAADPDAGGGRGLENIMNAVKAASKCSSFESAEQAEEWLAGVKGNLAEACDQCKSQKLASSKLVSMIVKGKQVLNEQLQKYIQQQGSGHLEKQQQSQHTNGMVSLEEIMQRKEKGLEPGEIYHADNGALKAPTPGLGFRMSPNLNDMDKENVLVPWGSLVCGVSHDENWLKVGDRYLPKFLKGIRVLNEYTGPPKSNLQLTPSHELSSPRRASSAPSLQPITESALSREGSLNDRENSEIEEEKPAVSPGKDKEGELVVPSSIVTKDPSSWIQSQTEQKSIEKETKMEVALPGSANEQEVRDLIAGIVKNSISALQDKLQHEANLSVQKMKVESSLTAKTLQSTLKGELQTIREQMREQLPKEILQCFMENSPKLLEQATELQKASPIVLDDKTRTFIEAVACQVYSDRAAESLQLGKLVFVEDSVEHVLEV
mmetsp:Transcript_114237/g.197533  ORF Transcript_114237/g.197533 Transcript_114237/m.197533 type:complete len:675 (-) Transcript_114237:145-2169(-)